MATLTLGLSFVNLMATGESVSGKAAVGRAEDYSRPGDVRTYAGGRRRTIIGAGEVGTVKFQLRYVPRTTIDTLHSWMGQLVEYRDSRGRRIFGTYLALSVEEVVAIAQFCTIPTGAWHAGIELTVNTAVEAV